MSEENGSDEEMKFFGPHHREIGRVATSFAELEMWVNRLVMHMVCGNRRIAVAWAALGGEPIDAQLERLKRVTPLVMPHLAEPVNEWVGKAKGLKDERNRILHSAWFGRPEVPGVGQALRFARRSLAKRSTSTQSSN